METLNWLTGRAPRRGSSASGPRPSVEGEITNQVLTVGDEAVVIDLSTKFLGATSYQVTPALSALTLDGAILTITPAEALAQTTITVRGLHEGAQSAPITFSLTIEAQAQPTVPAAPVPSLDGKTSGTITVSWPAPDDGGSAITGYRIYVDSSLAVSNANSPHQLVELSPSTQYSITITAVNTVGESAQSIALVVTTDAQPAGVPVVVTPPGIDAGPHELDDTVLGVTGTWTNDPTGYERRWQVRDATTMVWSEVAGETGLTCAVTAMMDSHDLIRMQERAENTAGWSAWADSNAEWLEVQTEPVEPEIEDYFGDDTSPGAIFAFWDGYDTDSVQVDESGDVQTFIDRAGSSRVLTPYGDAALGYADGEVVFGGANSCGLDTGNDDMIDLLGRHFLIRLRIGAPDQSRGLLSPNGGSRLLRVRARSDGLLGLTTRLGDESSSTIATTDYELADPAELVLIEIRHETTGQFTVWAGGAEVLSQPRADGSLAVRFFGERTTSTITVESISHVAIVHCDEANHNKDALEPAVLAMREYLLGPLDVPEALPAPPEYDPLAATTSIANHGQTIDVSTVAAHGTSADDVAWIQIPAAGAWVHSMSLNARLVDGKTVDGAQVSPQAGQKQGLTEWVSQWDASKTAVSPFLVRPGDTLVLARGRENIGSTQRAGVVSQYSAFVFTDAAQNNTDFSPSPTRFVGSKLSSVAAEFENIDVAGWVDSLPTPLDYSAVDYVPVQDVIAYIGNFNPVYMLTHSVVPAGYESLYPYSGVPNYGRENGMLHAAAALHLVGNIATRSEKIQLATHLVSLGKQAMTVAERDPYWKWGDPSNGGHRTFKQYAALVYLLASGRGSDLHKIEDHIPGNLLEQPFVWTAPLLADLAPHDDPTKPYISRRREIIAGSVSGNTLYVSAGMPGDGGKANFHDLLLTRESDSAAAYVTDRHIGSYAGQPAVEIIIEQQPGTPFAGGDVVYFSPDYTPEVGDVGWSIKGLLGWNSFTASGRAAYFNQQTYEGFVLFARALGVWHGGWQKVEDLCVMCRAANTPSVRNDFPPMHGDTLSYRYMIRDVWDTHGETLIPALSP